ncbi:MAG: flagellar basal body-associated FliL family protein [Bacillota bacterium]|jgi:flagellar FliL protein|nr:flagellar basal body-associated FliL family protein [Candidatus Fermentithermobacillaceae bacterium]
MRRVLLVVLALVVTAGVGYAAASRVWGFPTLGDRQEASAASEMRFALLSLGQFLTNLADSGRYIRVTVDLEIDAQRAELVTDRTSELKTDVYALLRSKTYADLSGEEGLRELQKEIRDRMELKCPHVVKNVFFSEFVIQ